VIICHSTFIVMTTVLTIGFWAVLLYFGYTTCVYVLKLRDVPAICGGMALFGVVAFTVLANGLSFLLPVQTAFVITFILLLVWSLIWTGVVRSKSIPVMQWEVPPRWHVMVLLFTIFLAGFAYARDTGEVWWTTYALPATLLEGNFPIMEHTNPWQLISYHYAAPFFVTGLSFLTGLPFSYSYAFLPLVCSASVVLFACAIAWRLTRSWGAATLAGVFALASAGLYWLQGWRLVRDLFAVYVFGGAIDHSPFWWLTPTIRNMHAQSLVNTLNQKAVALGAACLFGLLFVLMELFSRNQRNPIRWAALAVPLALCLALSSETSFVVVLIAVVVFSAALIVGRKIFLLPAPYYLRALALALLVIIPAYFIALHQGGVLSVLQGNVGSSSFTLSLDGRIHHHFHNPIAFWEWRFWRDYGVHVIIWIYALSFVWRKRVESATPMLLWLVAAAHFLVPFVIFYSPFPANLNRMITVFFGLTGIFMGVMFWQLWNSKSFVIRSVISVMTVAVLLGSTMNASVRAVFPTLELEKNPLIPITPTASAEESEMYEWIDEHTTLDDWFYIYAHPDSRDMLNDQIRFTGISGRFVVDWGFINAPLPEKEKLIVSLRDQCDAQSFDALGIRYLAIPTERQVLWFSDYCNAREWNLVLGKGEYRRIFERSGG